LTNLSIHDVPVAGFPVMETQRIGNWWFPGLEISWKSIKSQS